MAKVIKDYCGVLTEESIRKNFVLIYELVDEMMDFGYPQITSTEMLKVCVHNEASITSVAGVASPTSSLLTLNARSKPSGASNIPITMASMGSSGNSKNEIYVDIIERLTVLFNTSGYVVNSSIDGSILMKSFLAGNPKLRLALNEDLAIGRQGSSYGGVVLDDCNFHECVGLDDFEHSRELHFFPPDGEFAVMNYRVTADFRAPFKIFPTVEITGQYKIELTCTIHADIPECNQGTNVVVRVPVPRSAVSVTVEHNAEGGGAAAEYNTLEKKVTWNIRKFPGGSDLTIRVKITLDQPVTQSHKKEVGPISLAFEIPMYNVSNLQVRYLRILETDKSYNPHRWVRYITQSSSYVYRL
jgi:AP-4 complex subunit mu-1